MALFFPINDTAAPYALEVTPKMRYRYHASSHVDIMVGNVGDVIMVYSTTLHKVSSPGSEHKMKRTLFVPLVPKGTRIIIHHPQPRIWRPLQGAALLR